MITKREGIFYFIVFILLFIGGLTLMSLDNFHWITASPEFDSSHTVCNDLDCWTGPVEDYTFGEKVDYVLKYRIYTVFTHPRDLLAVGIYAFGLIFLLVVGRELFKLNLLKKLSDWIN